MSRLARRAMSKAKELHVGIVGGGLAGLRCADVLLGGRDVKVTVLEGRDRLGGRVAQASLLGHTVDLGPNWIHGTASNPILDICHATSTPTWRLPDHQAAFSPTGAGIPPAKSDLLSDAVWSIISDAFAYSREHGSSIPPGDSLMTYFERRTAELHPGAENEELRQLIMESAELWGAFVGTEARRQSLRFFWLEENLEGENLFVSGTYRRILEAIAKPALGGADIRLDTVVTRIESIEEGNGGHVVKVNTADGGPEFRFDELVVTAPLGWLKQNKEAFVPRLPDRMAEAINSIGYGTLDKVYITFEHAFWQQDPHSDSKSGTYPPFTHFMAPSYTTSPSSNNPTHHNLTSQTAINLALATPTPHPTLLFYTYGSTSLHISSLIAAAGTDLAARDAALTSFFRPFYSLLPNFDAHKHHPPRAVLATNWAADPLAGYGSYSNFQTMGQRLSEDVEVMRDGMPERGLWVAGEHTAPFVALGTTTGAYWSGEAVAERILEARAGGEGSGRRLGDESDGGDGGKAGDKTGNGDGDVLADSWDRYWRND